MWVKQALRFQPAAAYHAAASQANMAYVFVLGGPGAGKGTQCSLLVKEFGFHHLSAGDLLRKFIAQGGPEAAQLAHIINNQGKIVPAHARPHICPRYDIDTLCAFLRPCCMQITVRLLVEAMQRSEARLCLIDGFPRNLENLQAWEAAVPNGCHFVLNYAAPMEVLERRLLSRADGSRSDDTIQTIRRRFHVRFLKTSARYMVSVNAYSTGS